MVHAYANRAWMTTATTGTGAITLGSAKAGYMTFAEAGIVNTNVLSYIIFDGNDFEIGEGTYTSSSTSMSRDTVFASKIAGTVGTTKLTLSGTAEVFLSPLAADPVFNDVTTTITVGYTVTPNNIGNMGTTGFTVNPALGNYQYCTRDGTSGTPTITAPTSDCAVDILLTNAASGTLVALTFSGFTVGSGIGAPITTTINQKFLLSIRRINAISTYSVYALQ